MAKLLSASALAQYHRDGFYVPIRVLSREEAAGCRRRLETYEAERGGAIGGELRHKTHLLFTWLDRLVRHPRILDAVEDVLGPNLLCWSSSFFIKEANDAAYVSWHQDATYWGLSQPDVVTAWLAFTDATVENGAMRMVPGSHVAQVAHRDTFAPTNLLSRGQEIAVKVDSERTVDCILQPGEMSLHHVKLVHGSEPNRSNDRRIGLAIRYIPTDVKQLKVRDSATLVRGRDEHGNFEPEPRPRRDLDPEMLAFHTAITERQAKILYRGTGVEGFRRN